MSSEEMIEKKEAKTTPKAQQTTTLPPVSSLCPWPPISFYPIYNPSTPTGFFPFPIPDTIDASFTQVISTETDTTKSLFVLKNTPKRIKAEPIKIIDSPNADSLVSKKKIKFVLMVRYDDLSIDGKMYVVPVLVDARTDRDLPGGLVKGFTTFKNGDISNKDDMRFSVISYREFPVVFKIVKGSAKKDIRIFIRFELRLYSKVESKYDIVGTTSSRIYRMFSHQSQFKH